MRLKQTISMILMSAFLASAFLGCSGGGSSSTASAGESTAASSVSFGTKKFNTTLHFIGIDNVLTRVAIKEKSQELKDKFGITVDFQQYSNEQASNKIAVSMAAGGADIDVFLFRPLDETLLDAQNGWLVDLKPYIDADPAAADYDDYMKASMDVCKDPKTGDPVGLPLMTEQDVIYYNKKLWAAAGLTENDYPKTMDDLYKVAGKLNQPSKGICGFATRGQANPAVTQFSVFLRAFGADFFDTNKKATINTPNAIEAFQFYGKLLRDYGPKGVLNMGWTDTWSLFTQGKAALRLDANTNLGSWDAKNSAISLDDIGCFDVPKGPRGDYGNYSITSWAAGISYGSQKKDAAWAFINWMASADMQKAAQKEGNSSARTSVWKVKGLSSWPQQFQDLAASVGSKAHGTDRPYMTNVSKARDDIGEVIVTAIKNGDVKSAADKANQDFQTLLDSEKK